MKKNKNKQKDKKERGPFQDKAFITNYVIRYQKEEFARLQLVLKELKESYQDILIKKKEAENWLKETVDIYVKKQNDLEKLCVERELEFQLWIENAEQNAFDLVSRAEDILGECRRLLDEYLEYIDEKKRELRELKEYAKSGGSGLLKEIEKLEKRYQNMMSMFYREKEFFMKLLQEATNKFITQAAQAEDETKLKYLDKGIDDLTKQEWKVLDERNCMELDKRFQTQEAEVIKKEIKEEEEERKSLTRKLWWLRKIFYHLVPTPQWAADLCYKKTDRSYAYLCHYEDNLEPFEQQFKVPLTIQTVCMNYSHIEPIPIKPTLSESLIVELGEKMYTSRWNIDTKKVIEVTRNIKNKNNRKCGEIQTK